MSYAKAALPVAKDGLYSRNVPAIYKDGRGVGSVPLSMNNVFERKVNSQSKPEIVTLFAGYNNNLQVRSDGDLLQPDYANFFTSSPYVELPKKIWVSTTVDTRYKDESPTEACVAWRCVAAGLRMSLTNNQEEDDGWWEAIRFKPNWKNRLGTFLTKTGPGADLTLAGCNPNPPTNILVAGHMAYEDSPAYFQHWWLDAKQQFAGHSSYCSGKLRDLHHFTFRLKRTGKDHPFMEFGRPNPNQDEGDYPLINPVGSEDQTPWFDPNWDVVTIRIYPRQATGEAVSSRLLYDVRMNAQYQYDESSLLGKVALGMYYNALRGIKSKPKKRKPMRRSRRRSTKRRR